ncbi:MAG: hypothetical protein ACEQSX_14555, partial [Baekduiaceae bacterium]
MDKGPKNRWLVLAVLASSLLVVALDATILNVAHLTPPRAYYVGEEEGKGVGVDYRMPSEKIGSTRMPILVGGGGSVAAVV